MDVLSCLTAWPAGPLLITYLSGEFVFLLFFYHVLLPRCNQLTEPQEYRDYGRDRHLLMVRIMRRMERTCRATGTSFLPAFATFLRQWFVHHEVPARGGGDTCSKFHPLSDTQEEKKQDDRDEYVASMNRISTLPRKGDMDSFFSWAFFGRDHATLEGWMRKELDQMYTVLQESHGISFPPGSTTGVKPMRLTLDPIQPSYRPLLVYLSFSVVQLLGNLFLRASGFHRYKAPGSGLRYWYRSQRRMLGRAPLTSNSSNPFPAEEKLLPMVFFHGIAPGGIALYLPMLLWGFGRDGRALYIFENPPISFRLCPRIYNEAATVNGVWGAVNRHHGPDAIVSLLAHSFGSCQATWLLKSTMAHRIRQTTLIDPVSIMLSEPDVMTNFLYQRHAYNNKKTPLFNKIGVVANEIFIEYYLRRHFAWYNSELWLEDVPVESKVVICLSSNDEILNAPKVKREVEIYSDDIGGSMKGGLKSNNNNKVELVVWDDAGHGYCISCPRAWKQTRAAMRRQEHLILKEESLKEC